MNEKNLKKILDRLEERYKKASENDKQKIKELETELKYKAPHFHFSDIVFPKKLQVTGETKITNLPETQKVEGELEIKNFPKSQKIFGEVEIKNFPKQKEIQKVEITNLPAQKEITKPSWVDSIIDGMLMKLATLLATVSAKTVEMIIRSNITVDFAKPQFVIPVDIHGKPIDYSPQFRTTNVVVGSGSSATSSAITDPVTGYKVADIDESGTVKYYGFMNKSGNWYVMANDTSANTFRYVKGTSGYATNWTNRATLTYDYFNIIFG